jgi:hypothetical protein
MVVEINQKLSTRAVEKEDVLVALNREVIPLVEKMRLALSRLVKRWLGEFHLSDYGASSDGTAAENLEAFTKALTAATSAGGGTLVFSGRLVMTSEVAWPTGVSLRGDGDSSVLDYSGVTVTTVAIRAAGTQGTGVPLLASVNEGDETITLSSGEPDEDSWGKVYSEATTGSTGWKQGEICRFAAGGTLYDPLCDTYTVANSASYAPIEFVENVTFRDFKIEGPADNSVIFSGILADRTLNARFENLTLERCHFYGVGLQDSVSATVSGCSFSKSESGNLAYGVAIFNASQDVAVTNCRGYRLRHLVTHGGFTTRNGVPRRTVTSNCVASQCRNSGFDAHASGEDISFNNCTVLGSESDGFTIECVSATLTGCSVRDSLGPAFHLNPQSLKPFNVTLDGCRASGKGYSDSRSGVQIQVNAGYENFDAITINGGTFLDCRYGVRTINATATAIDNVTISGATFQRCGLDGDAVIQVTNAEGVTVSGNTIADTTNSVDGVSLTAVVGFAVTGNTIRLTGTGGCRGVRCLTTCASGTIDGNYVDTGASGIGIGLADATTNVTIGSGNDLRDCPTGYSLGAGTGHIFSQQPLVSSDRGDNDIVLTHNDAQTQIFNTALTSDANITLPSANVRMRFRVVREAGATGAFSVNVGALKALGAASTWCEVQSDGTNYRLVASGAL